MSIASKRAMFAVSAGLWFAASALAVFLVYELNRPLHAVGTAGTAVGPFAVALLAVGWLAFISVAFGWGSKVVRKSHLVHA